MATKKLSINDIISKYQSNKLLSANDCGVILDTIYNRFVESGEKSSELWDMLLSNAEKIVKKNNRPLSDNEAKTYYGLSFCNNHTAKMAGMESISTNNRDNSFCKAHKACKGSICEKCFADNMLKFFKSMGKALSLNYLLLNYKLIPEAIIPIINRQFARIESFGDVETEIQAANYIRIMTAHAINKNCRFAAWSKNPMIWFTAFEKYGKPHNLSFGVSSLFINVVMNITKKFLHYVDFIFTVFESEKKANESGYTINCGARHCLSCLHCYMANDMKAESGNIEYIIEELK